MADSKQHAGAKPEAEGVAAEPLSSGLTRRQWLAQAAFWGGLAVGYGTLAWQYLAFILPKGAKPPTRLLFAGSLSDFPVGGAQKTHDLEGNEVLIRRTEENLKAFSSRCPHLGCRVHWEYEEGSREFFCPCHGGVFDADGNPLAGPPAQGNQHMEEVPLVIDADSQVVYLEVRDVKSKERA